MNHEHDKLFAFKFFRELPNIFPDIKVVGIRDGNKNGWRCNPRYDIKVLVDKSISYEEVDKLYNELENLIISKNDSDDKLSFEYSFSFMGLYDDYEDVKYCDYKYYKN